VKHGARLGFAGAAVLGALVGCGASDDADGAAKGSGPDNGSSSGGTTSLPGGMQVPDPQPEQEVDEAFQAPVVSGRFVWTANPTSGVVALIDAETFAVQTVPAGAGPTYLAALPTTDGGSRAVVINSDSEDATLLSASQAGEVEALATLPVHAGANAWAVTSNGRFAVAWTNAAAAKSPDPSEGFQDITVLDLQGDEPSSKRLSVGFRPVRVFVDDDSRYVYFVTDSGIDVVDLLSEDGPIVEREVALSDNPARDTAKRDVNITPDGTFAFVSRQDQSYVTVVDVAAGVFKDVALPGVVTDLDLSADASLAVAIVQQSTPSADPSAAGAGAGGQATEASEGGGTSVELGGGGGLGAGEVGASGEVGAGGKSDPPVGVPRSLAVLLPVASIFTTPDLFESVAIDVRVASVELGQQGDTALLYQNGMASPLLTLLGLEAGESFARYRTLELKLPVFYAKSSPDGQHAVVLLAPPAGSAKPGAFAVVPLVKELPAAIQGTAARTVPLDFAKEQPAMVAIDDAHALVTVTNQLDVHVAYLVGMPALTVDAIPLASAPLPGASGIVPAANRAFVAQSHPEGRITFIDLDSGKQRTLTGFELSAQVKP
jgi:hypothetical protein